MTFDLRLLVISLATFLTASLAGSALVPWLSSRRFSGPPSARASALYRLRMLPVAIAIAATLQGVASFVLFEPRGQQETFGVVLIALAAAGAALLALAVMRLLHVTFLTERALQQWMESAEVIVLPGIDVPTFSIESPFPVVAVVGIFKPRLVVARSVLAACPPEELEAILAHEQRHLVNRDNVRRAVLACLPDALALTTAGRRLTALWHEAAEEAADDCSTELGAAGRVHLASALVRVARLAPAGRAAIDLPASALYRGENLERRIRRLLAGPPVPVDERASRLRRALMGGGLIISGGLALHAMHELVEAAVSFLP